MWLRNGLLPSHHIDAIDKKHDNEDIVGNEMTDYVRAYDHPTNVYHKEARRLADQLRTETTLVKRGINRGVLRWKSNNKVVPEDAANLAYAIGIGVSLSACQRVRDAELARFFSEYRNSCAVQKPSADEQAERVAAFGRGATIINIITGEKYTT